MKRPLPDSASASQAYLASRNGLVSRIATSVSQRSSGKSRTGATCWMPALATTTSSRPKRSSARLARARVAFARRQVGSNGVPAVVGAGRRPSTS